MNLLCVIPGIDHATSLYRAMGPFGVMKRKDPSFHISLSSQINWATLSMHDALFIQRPYLPVHLTVLEMAHACNIPVWIDYDDNIFAIPTDNPSFPIWSNPETQRIAATCLAKADIVTVSTKALAEAFSPLTRQSPRIIHNAHNGDMFGGFAEAPSTEPLVMWRGSETHVRDLMSQKDSIVQLTKDYKGITFFFCGYNPWFITDGLKNVHISKGIDPLEYFPLLRRIKPRVLIVPLAKNAFNEGKSNIAWLEATYAGAVCVAPDLPEWQKPGVLRYEPESQKSFYSTVCRAISAPKEHSAWHDAKQFIEANLLIEHVNESRFEVIRDLLSMRTNPDWRQRIRENRWRDAAEQTTEGPSDTEGLRRTAS